MYNFVHIMAAIGCRGIANGLAAVEIFVNIFASIQPTQQSDLKPGPRSNHLRREILREGFKPYPENGIFTSAFRETSF